MSRTLLSIAAGAACLLAVAARAETVKFHAALNGAAEVPAKTTPGQGTVEATLDTATKKLDYTGTYSGLTGPATAGHFHGPAEPGANASVVLPWTMSTPGKVEGTATLTDAQMADLMAGKWYANMHTAANTSGEIRGQMKR